MPDRLTLKQQARQRYQGADARTRDELDACLDYIQEHPEPDGSLIISFQRPPVVFFVYDDGKHRISYTYWRRMPSREVVGTVYAVR